MNIIKSDAFVIKSLKYRDTSKIVTLFSSEFGKFNALVKGARNIKSNFRGSLDSISLVSIILNKKEQRELQVIRNSEVSNPYWNIKSNFNKLSLAYELVSLVHSGIHFYDKNLATFTLMKNIFDHLDSEQECNLNVVKLFFKLGFLKALGFQITDTANVNETFLNKIEFKLNRVQLDIVNKLQHSQFDLSNEMELADAHLKVINDYLDIILDELSLNKSNRRTKLILDSMAN